MRPDWSPITADALALKQQFRSLLSGIPTDGRYTERAEAVEAARVRLQGHDRSPGQLALDLSE